MLPPDPVASSSAAAAVLAAAAAAAGGWLARGTTAVPAAVWATAAAVSLAVEMACRALEGLADPAASDAARLVTVSLALCPAMALLGAKRPQHGVWQMIVGSLAVVLAMPAISAAVVRPGTPPDVHVLGRGFMALLLAVGWMNFVGTRHGVAAALATVGATILARPALPFVHVVAGSSPRLECAGCWMVAAGDVLAVGQSVWLPVRPSASAALAGRIDRPYLALRETLGAAWTLRLAERFNEIAAGRGWPCRLSFGGLDAGGDPADTFWHRDAVRVFGALARRFATAEWLRRHGFS